MARPKRSGKPPLGVQVQVLLCMLGMAGKRIEWDHRPPLGLRPVDPETGELDPPENDPRYIEAVVVEEHAERTREDVCRIAKAKRQAGETGQHARRKRRGAMDRILKEQQDRVRLAPRKLKSGPMPGTRKSRLRKRMDGTVERRET